MVLEVGTCDFELWNLSFVHILGIWYLIILHFKSNWCQNLLYLILRHILWLVFIFFRFLLTEGILNLIIWFNLILRINPQDPIINIIFPRSPVICLKKIIQESVNYICLKRSQDRAPSMFTTLKTEQVKKPQDLF